MNRRHALSSAAFILIFLVASNVPFAVLAQTFGYDDVLREPAGVVLERFHAGGSSLVLTWLGFALSACLFMPVALGLSRLAGTASPTLSVVTLLGLISALVQVVGLLRWVFVVPALAAAYTAPDASEAIRAAAILAFQTQHQFGGVLLGEFFGQLLLVCWTAGISMVILRGHALPRWLGIAGLATVPLWILGFSELLHSVIPAVPAVEAAPIAFTAWGLWLLAVAAVLCNRALRRESGASATTGGSP